RDGSASPQPQPRSSTKARTRPRHLEIEAVRRKLPHWKKRGPAGAIARNLYLLFVYYNGIYSLARLRHRFHRSRAAIYLHHRVNDYSKDVLTVDLSTFTAQLLAISRRYPFASTSSLVESIRAGKPIRPTTVAIHFDDCYRDILINGAPILEALRVPACAFLNSGFVDTDRSFEHDTAKNPFHYPKLRSSDLVEWVNRGFEAGSHTVNHVDLGKYVESSRFEIADCGPALEKILGRRVDFFSFPFGRVDNITPAAIEAIREAGYVALFAAHGGFVGAATDPYDIPRLGASYLSPPVYCLLEIEGLAPHQLFN
ncbi:MAG TPA: polysaccharide deacetylase family protein, partial [Bryobacteraceae bacterium]|nr:polysaccharide deacetylase family protein [Bryobacteraceae bacterium]